MVSRYSPAHAARNYDVKGVQEGDLVAWKCWATAGVPKVASRVQLCRALCSRPGELQIQRVAGPRNQLSTLTNVPCDKYGTNARADRASSLRLSISRSRG